MPSRCLPWGLGRLDSPPLMMWRTIFPMAAVFLPTLAAAAEAAPEPKQEIDVMHIYHQGGFSMSSSFPAGTWRTRPVSRK